MQMQMQMHTLTLIFGWVPFFLLMIQTPWAEAEPTQDLVRSSCAQARYPTLCLQTLLAYYGATDNITSKDLADAALKISLAHAAKLSDYLKTVQARQTGGGGRKREGVAVRDCVDQISASVDDLRRTVNELRHLREETMEWQMSNSQTWVSAALTNDGTCVDGLRFKGVDPVLSSDLNRRIAAVARLTSNALCLLARLAQTHPFSAPVP